MTSISKISKNYLSDFKSDYSYNLPLIKVNNL